MSCHFVPATHFARIRIAPITPATQRHPPPPPTATHHRSTTLMEASNPVETAAEKRRSANAASAAKSRLAKRKMMGEKAFLEEKRVAQADLKARRKAEAAAEAAASSASGATAGATAAVPQASILPTVAAAPMPETQQISRELSEALKLANLLQLEPPIAALGIEGLDELRSYGVDELEDMLARDASYNLKAVQRSKLAALLARAPASNRAEAPRGAPVASSENHDTDMDTSQYI